MSETSHDDLSPEGQATIQAVDEYLHGTLSAGHPIEALIATRRLGEIANARAKEAARLATDASWSWSDVGRALGMTKQAAHEKLRARARDEMDQARSKLERAERTGRAKITRRANSGREGLDRAIPFSPKIDSARERIDEWEQNQHDKLARKIEKARKTVAHAERSVQEKLDRKAQTSRD